MKINSFEDLDCWQEARILVRKIYEVTRDGDFKKDLRFRWANTGSGYFQPWQI